MKAKYIIELVSTLPFNKGAPLGYDTSDPAQPQYMGKATRNISEATEYTDFGDILLRLALITHFCKKHDLTMRPMPVGLPDVTELLEKVK